MSTSKRPFHPLPTDEGMNKRETSDDTIATFCSLSDCGASEIMTSPKQCSCTFNKSRNGSFTRRSKCSDHSLHGMTSPTIFEEGFATTEMSTSKRPFHPLPTDEGMNKRETSDDTIATFCSLSDCGASESRTSPKQFSCTKALCSSKDRQSVCSFLSMSSLCGLDIVQETSSGVKLNDKVSVFLPSEFSATMFKPLSMNSLGLSVDSTDASMDQRDLFTPPMAAGARISKQMRSPPQLRCRDY